MYGKRDAGVELRRDSPRESRALRQTASALNPCRARFGRRHARAWRAFRTAGALMALGAALALALATRGATTPSVLHAQSPALRQIAAHRMLDACRVMSRRDATPALGAGKAKTIDTRGFPLSICTYNLVRSPRFVVLQVASTWMLRKSSPKSRRPTARSYWQTVRSSNGRIHSVPHLGNGAFWVSSRRELWVVKGDVVFSLGGSVSHLESRVRKVARRVVAGV